MATWVSVHVFYAGDLDVLLLDGVGPALRRLRDSGAVDRWFYVRYWNGGLHLRVRLQYREEDAASVATALPQELAGFLREHPGGHPDPVAYRRQADAMRSAFAAASADGIRSPEEVEPLQRGDTVQIRPYEYESQRYGGPVARELTEGHFWRSSQLASTVVAHSRGRRDARRGLALALLAEVPAALRMAPDDVRSTFLAYRDTLWTIGRTAAKPDTMPVARQLPDPAERGPRALAPVARELWRREIMFCSAALHDLWTAGRLTCPPPQVLLSYAHMLNNRLGISVTEEAQLCQALAEAAVIGELYVEC